MDKTYKSLLFDDEKIAKYAGQDVLESLIASRKEHKQPDRVIIEKIAEAMQKWALENGATHYTHWFLPQGGSTAEKMIPLTTPAPNSEKEINFSAECLLVGESDGSSFPSGGLRNTFEARGSSTWDFCSPAFIKKFGKSNVLYIPTNFYAFKGEMLDKKTPLIKSTYALQKQVSRLMQSIGYGTKEVINYVGVEQEYFLIDKQLFNARPDLNILGRTIIGKENKNLQYRVGHYSGTFSKNVAKFVTKVNEQLTTLGITPCAEHLEVSPNQFEIALTYDRSPLVIDQNQILVDIMKNTAEEYDMVALFDEKPFRGVNGSGKHTNWSVAYGEDNLFSFGKKGEYTLRFLLTLAIFIKACDMFPELIIGTIANRSNEFRLGEKEAPPMILSLYITQNLSNAFEMSKEEIANLKLSKEYCNCDRNRTSPLAFTGNKFEFRAVGSSQSISLPVTSLNTAFAYVCSLAADRLEKATNKQDEIINIIKDYYNEHKRIIFNGNCYSKEWPIEAKKRGLTIITNIEDAIKNIASNKNIELAKSMDVLSEKELNARVNVSIEAYTKNIELECTLMIEMLKKYIIPSAYKQLKSLQLNHLSDAQNKYLNLFNEKMSKVLETLDILQEGVNSTFKSNSDYKSALENARNNIDDLMSYISKENDDLPSYDDLLLKL